MLNKGFYSSEIIMQLKMYVSSCMYVCIIAGRGLYVSSPVSWPLVPTEELRLMMRRSTSFLSKTREAGPSSDIALPPK